MIKIKQIKSHASIPVYVGIELATDNLKGAIQKYLQERCDHRNADVMESSGTLYTECFDCGLTDVQEGDRSAIDYA